MKIDETYVLPGSREQIWSLLLDPTSLKDCLPGCEQLEQDGQDSYSATIKADIAAARGTYKANFRIAERNEPNHFTLQTEAKGNAGFLRGSAIVRLTPEGADTRVTIDGDGNIGGTVAGVGQRMLGGMAKMLMGQFFECLKKQVPAPNQAEGRPSTSPPIRQKADLQPQEPRQPQVLVFISAKSADYIHARKVYEYLISRGIRCFFSSESLQQTGRSDYGREIDRALEEAEHLIVVTSSKENAESGWVRHEWSSFLNEKRAERKSGNLVTVTVGSLEPVSLPWSLRPYEVVPIEKLERVLRYVRAEARE